MPDSVVQIYYFGQIRAVRRHKPEITFSRPNEDKA